MEAILPSDLIESGNIDQEILVMLIMLPVIATILGFARHVIGVKALGLYAPIIITYAFLELATASNDISWEGRALYGLKYGMILIFIVFITSALTHILTKRLHVHYFPKIALVLTSVSISIYALFIIANALGKHGVLDIGFIPVILISTVSEQFVSIMAKKNLKVAVSLAITTVVISSLVFIITIFEPFQDLLIKYPYLLVFTLLINLAVGRFTGLRASEYIRFKDILDKED